MSALRRAGLVLLLLAMVTGSARAEEVCDLLKGASILAQDDKNTFLGKVTNSYDSQSIFNEFGTYGNPFSSSSIWNEFSTFGSEFSNYSPFNKFTATPPMMVKKGKIVGYLSSNKFIKPSISPNMLKALCEDEL